MYLWLTLRLLLSLLVLFVGDGECRTHRAHLRGWYSQNGIFLREELNSYFSAVTSHWPVSVGTPSNVRALVVPHAGYRFSALSAAAAYQALRMSKSTEETQEGGNEGSLPRRIVIIGPSHTATFHGFALPDYTTYETPLGNVPVDLEAIDFLHRSDIFGAPSAPHDTEHSIEIQLPLLQIAMEDTPFNIVPLIMGTVSDDDVTVAVELLSKLLAPSADSSQPPPILIVTSDFMHYGANYGFSPFKRNILRWIRNYDRKVAEPMLEKSLEEFTEAIRVTRNTVCGAAPIRIMLLLMKSGGILQHTQSQLASYYTSVQLQYVAPHTLGSSASLAKLLRDVPDVHFSSSSVSYLSAIYVDAMPNEFTFSGFEKMALLHTARSVVSETFHRDASKVQRRQNLLRPVTSHQMKKATGVFVTIKTLKGALRGCIGRTFSQELIIDGIMEMSVSAAFRDQRFHPLTQEELEQVDFHISVLTTPMPVQSVADIEVGRHGVVLLLPSGASAVFLPYVAVEQRWDRQKMLSQLSAKAGADPNAWQSGGAKYATFESVDFSEIKDCTGKPAAISSPSAADDDCRKDEL